MSASTTKSDNPERPPKGQQNHLIQTSWRTLRFFDEEDHLVALYALSREDWSDFFEIKCFVASETNGEFYLGDICGSGVFLIADGVLIPDIIRIEEAHRRRGLATTICDIASEHAGVPWGKPTLLSDGIMFWSAYLGRPSTSFTDVGS